MKVLIFGANGQDGFYLDHLCRSLGAHSIGVSRSGDWLHVDVVDYASTSALIQEHQPDFIFHLAANSTTRHNALFENHSTLSTGTLNILEAVKNFSPRSKVFITGSGLQFQNSGKPISEQTVFEANNPYSLARIHSVYAARYYRTLGLKVYVGYLFHHDSPRRKEHHVSQMIASSARRIAGGSDETLEIGDISVHKEWAFAGDIVQGIWDLVQQEQVFEATMGTGVTYSIEDWLEQCFRIVGKQWRNHVRLREGFKPEYSRLVSDPTTMFSLGWRPSVDMHELAMMMVGAKGDNGTYSD